MVTLGNKQTTLRSMNKSEFMVLEMCLSSHFHSDRESKRVFTHPPVCSSADLQNPNCALLIVDKVYVC